MAQKGKWGQKCSQWFYNQLRKWYELPLVKRDSRERALESKGGFEDSFLLLELCFFSSRSLVMPLIGIWMIMLGLLGLDLFGLVVGVVTHLPSVKGKNSVRQNLVKWDECYLNIHIVTHIPVWFSPYYLILKYLFV